MSSFGINTWALAGYMVFSIFLVLGLICTINFFYLYLNFVKTEYLQFQILAKMTDLQVTYLVLFLVITKLLASFLKVSY